MGEAATPASSGLRAALHSLQLQLCRALARSVVLAGGTMAPIDDVVAQLFGHLPPSKVNVFSCGHVIPPENLLAVCIPVGPSGTPMELTFGARGK